MIYGSLDESRKNWLRMFRGALIFRVELDSDEERVSWKFHHLHKSGLWIASGGLKPGFVEILELLGVEFVTVTVALGNHIPAIYCLNKRVLFELAVIGS